MWLWQAAGFQNHLRLAAPQTDPLGADEVSIPAFLDLFGLDLHPELCSEDPREPPAGVPIMEASGSTGTVRAFGNGLVLKSPWDFKSDYFISDTARSFHVERKILESLEPHPRIVRYCLITTSCRRPVTNVSIDTLGYTTTASASSYMRQLTAICSII